MSKYNIKNLIVNKEQTQSQNLKDNAPHIEQLTQKLISNNSKVKPQNQKGHNQCNTHHYSINYNH